jgi:hypothetical protein
MSRHIAELLLAHQHEHRLPALAGRLVAIARKLPDRPMTISAFLACLRCICEAANVEERWRRVVPTRVATAARTETAMVTPPIAALSIVPPPAHNNAPTSVITKHDAGAADVGAISNVTGST